MYVFFLFVVIINLLIFLFKKRQFDFISIYFITLLLYNIPTVFGIVRNVYTGKFDSPNEYIYIVSTIPFLFNIMFLILKQPTSGFSLKFPKGSLASSKYNIFLFLSLVIYLYLLYTFLDAILASSSKRELLENTSVLSLIKAGIPPIAIAIAFLGKHKKYFYIFMFLTVLMFFFGARAMVVSVSMCLFIVLMHGKPFVIAKKGKLLFFGLIGLLVVVLGKVLYGTVLLYGFADGIAIWYNNYDSSFLLKGAEFMNTSAILNEVIIQDFSIPTTDVLGSLLSILPVSVSSFGLKSSIFNDRFQNTLFSGIEYGMAYNIWAEAYSWLGLLGVIICSFIIPFALYKLYFLYSRRSNHFYGILIVLVGFTLAFWIHRNSIGTILAYLRNFIYPLLIIWLFTKIIYSVKKKNRT